MRPLALLIASLLLIICGFISSLRAAPQPLLPTIDLEFIIAGLAHTEAQLNSGTCRLKHFAADHFNTKKIVDKEKEPGIKKPQTKRKVAEIHTVVDVWLAFSGEHNYFKYSYSDSIIQYALFDGRINLYPGKPPAFSAKKSPTYNTYDPRNWGIWFKGHRLSNYLQQQNGGRVIGSETLNGIACYIVETLYPVGPYDTTKFWIAPEGGFRLLQAVQEANDHKLSLTIEWQQYQFDTGIVWFPKHGVLLSSGKDKLLRNEVEITDFQPNIDVSSFFDLQISPETEVFHLDLEEFTTFEEIGWKQLGPTSK